MSPTRASKPRKTLTIEFAGICTLVWHRKAGLADIRLVDLASAGFQRHYAALGIVVNERTLRTIKGPEADAAISLPANNLDLGIWNLIGCDVEIVGASTAKLTVDDSKVDVTKKPPKSAESIRWLADIGYLAESSSPNTLCPTAATVKVTAGRVTSSAAGARRVTFTEHDAPVGPTRYCVPSLKAVIPFDDELGLMLDRRRILRFTDSMSVAIANTCVCAVGLSGLPDHFFAHYDVVQAKRRPKPVPPQGSSNPGVVAGPQFSGWPELCSPGFVEVP